MGGGGAKVSDITYKIHSTLTKLTDASEVLSKFFSKNHTHTHTHTQIPIYSHRTSQVENVGNRLKNCPLVSKSTNKKKKN